MAYPKALHHVARTVPLEPGHKPHQHGQHRHCTFGPFHIGFSDREIGWNKQLPAAAGALIPGSPLEPCLSGSLGPSSAARMAPFTQS